MKSATPEPTAGPRGRDRQAAPPRPSGGSARGPEGPPRAPPPLPLRPKSRQRQTEETAAHLGFYGVQKSQNQLQSEMLLFLSDYTIKRGQT